MKEKKIFGQIKPGDTVYKVCIYDYKTRIIKKKVKKVEPRDFETIRIYCECKDSEYYQNFFPGVLTNASIHVDKYAVNAYLCADIKSAKIACNRLANDIVSKTEKEINKLSQRLNRWRLHQEELHNENYVIK